MLPGAASSVKRGIAPDFLGHARSRCTHGLGGAVSWRDWSRALAQKDVGRTFARDVLRAFIAQSTHIDVVQEMLPGTE